MGENPAPGSTTSAILVAAVVALAALRLATVSGPVAAHDGAHWATALALMTRGDAELGRRVVRDGHIVDEGVLADAPWQTVDVVLAPASGRFFSSKPWPTAAAAAVIARGLEWTTGWRLARETPQVVRWTLVLLNVAPFAWLLLALRAWLLRRRTPPGASALTLMAAGTSGAWAFLTALNGHVLAAIAVGALVLRQLSPEGSSPTDDAVPVRRALFDGLLAGLVAVTEAAGFVWVVVILVDRGRTRHPGWWATFLGVAVVAGVFLLGNKAFTGWWLPLYLVAHADWYAFAGAYWSAPVGIDLGEASVLTYAWHALLGHHGVFSQSPLLLVGLFGALGAARRGGARSMALGLAAATLIAVGLAAARKLLVLPALGLVDGLIVAVAVAIVIAPPSVDGDDRMAQAARQALATSFGVLAFYLAHSKNYGGVSSFFRYGLLLGPLLWVFIPAALESPSARRAPLVVNAACALGLAVAAVHAARIVDNPFVHPLGYDEATDAPQTRAGSGRYRW